MVPDLQDRPSMGRLRAFVAARVAATSLRMVAREIGVSPTGLRKFLNGAEPYSPTRRKLSSWFVQYAARHAVGMDADVAIAALRLLTDDIPDRQGRALEVLVQVLERSYTEAGRSIPEWLSEVKAVLEQDRP